MKNKILIVGGGGHAQSCIDIIENEKKYQIFGIIDINPSMETKHDSVVSVSDVKNIVYDTLEIVKREYYEREIKKWFYDKKSE